MLFIKILSLSSGIVFTIRFVVLAGNQFVDVFLSAILLSIFVILMEVK